MPISRAWKQAILLLIWLVAADVSDGQIWPGRPIVGSTDGNLPKQPQLSAQSDLNPGIKVHKNPFGKPCVTVGGYARPKMDYRKIFGGGQTTQGSEKGTDFNHIVSARNGCSQTIKLKVCYYESQSCVTLEAPAYGVAEAFLGLAANRGFRYQYTEQF